MSRTWQLLVHGLEGRTYCIDVEKPQRTTVLELKKKLEEKTGIEPETQRLIFSGKQLQDENFLTTYDGIQNNSTLFLVLRLPGGAEACGFGPPASQPLHQFRKPDPSLPKSEKECIITYMKGESLEMPCGHAISPEGLMEYCKHELGTEKKPAVKCPECSTEWPIGVLKRYSCATPLESMFLELKLSESYCSKTISVVECPSCHTLSEPKDPSRVDVRCDICSRRKERPYVFCWHCLKECTWKSKSTKYTCENPYCSSRGQKQVNLQIIQDAPTTKVIGVKCPSIRACPHCGVLIEHIEYCKHMKCKMCKTDFCFLCLQVKPKSRDWPCGFSYKKCKVAPRQKSIPLQP